MLLLTPEDGEIILEDKSYVAPSIGFSSTNDLFFLPLTAHVVNAAAAFVDTKHAVVVVRVAVEVVVV